MATEFKLPELGEGIDGGDVIEVLVAEGDQVEDGQTLLELETSKATIPVPAPHAGRVVKLHVKPGDHVEVGKPLVTIDGAPASVSEGETSGKASDTSSSRAPEPGSAVRTSGSKQAKPAPAVRHEEHTDSLKEQGPRDGQEPPVQQRGSQRTVASEPTRKPVQPEASAEPPARESGESVAAGPATRRLARELGVDLHHVTGNGPNGRITEEDVKSHVRQIARRATPEPTAPAHAAASLGADRQAAQLPDFSRWGPIKREALGSVRRKTAEHMSLAWKLIPQVTHFDEADITQLEEFRKRHGERAAARGAKLTVTAVALKAVAVALKSFPQINATLDSASGELILKQYYHIGVAVDTERGLIVPVIRDVDKKSLLDIAVELGAIADRARQKKVTLDDLQGGTFTITNLGGLGGTGFSPIVNYPEAAILGLARAREQQVIRQGRAEIRLMLPLCVSYDHRVIDGATAARFTRRVAELLEDPFLMVLEG